VVQLRRSQRLVSIPDVAGKELTEAQEILAAAGLRWETVEGLTGPAVSVTRGYVSVQSPEAQLAPADTVVKLVVSEALVTVPTLIGLPLQDATNALQGLRLNLKVGDPVVSLSAETRDGVIQSQKPDPGSRLAPNGTVLVRQVRLAPQVVIVDAFMATERAKLWEPGFNAAGFRVGARQPAASSFTPPAVAEVRYFDAAGAADVQKMQPALKASGIEKWKVIGSDGPRRDDSPYIELVLPSPLQKYRVDIIHYDGDRYGLQLAALIARTLREKAFAADVRQSPKPADKLDALYPPRTFEVRYEKGEEDAASYLLAILKTVKEVTSPVLFLVDAKPTLEYLSIFIPRQPEPAAARHSLSKGGARK
jgi:hypothetical protein